MQIIILYPCNSSFCINILHYNWTGSAALCHIFKANICSEDHPLPSADKWPLKSTTEKSTE